ncbi:hypothetical protein JVU11DRAFT_12236 [Chiua virens]|nr:hypothetical protein JVU11DRAFT_12236 [Chiua virens]
MGLARKFGPLEAQQTLVRVSNGTTEWIEERLDIHPNEMLFLPDTEPYEFQFVDTPGPTREGDKYLHAIPIDALAAAPERFIQLGTLSGSSRLRLWKAENRRLRGNVRRHMVFANAALTSAAERIGEVLGRMYVAPRVRVSDGHSKRCTEEREGRLVETRAGRSGGGQMTVDGDTQDEEEDIMDALGPPEIPPDKPSLRVPLSNTIFPNLSCRKLLFIATDAPLDLDDPLLAPLIRTFPCTLILTSFESEMAGLEGLQSGYDDVPLAGQLCVGGHIMEVLHGLNQYKYCTMERNSSPTPADTDDLPAFQKWLKKAAVLTDIGITPEERQHGFQDQQQHILLPIQFIMSKHDANVGSDLTDYITAMQKTNFTQNWDVVVTHGQKKINDLLAEKFQTGNHGLLTNIELSIETDRFGDKITQWYQFSLGSPCVQFESSPDSPTCSLTIAITTGKIWTVPRDGSTKEALDLEPNTYTISIRNINLGAITGIAQEMDDAKTFGISGGNELVVLPDEDGYSAHIVFDFAASSMLCVSLDHVPNIVPPYALKQDQLLTALQESLIREIRVIPYTLAVVNNAIPGLPEGADLAPRSIHFTTIGAPSNGDSYLSIFIQTRSSERRKDDLLLQSLWIDGWTKAGVMPIPKGHSSSIIVKDSFFATSIIIPALETHNATCVLMEKTSNVDDGICVKATWPKLSRPDASWESHVRLIALEETKNFWIHSVEYDPNIGGKSLQITLAQSNGLDKPPTVSLEWSYGFENRWNGTISRTERDPPVVGVLVRNILELNGTFKSSYSVSLKKDLVNSDDDSFEVEVKKSDWTVEASKAKSTDIRGVHLPIPGELVDQKKLLELAKDAAIDTIRFEFNLSRLGLLAQTNVLPAGKATTTDIQFELRIPRDVVVIGGVVAA